MKLFCFHGGRRQRGGFNLVEATFSIGIFSFGFLTLAPLLALGMKMARLGRNDQATAQVAQTLIEEAKQGTLATSVIYFDIQGNPLTSAQSAAFTVQSTSQLVSGSNSLTQLKLQITPLGAPDRARTYAVIYPTPPPPTP
jgi:uncharacterized protein (TIGR02598 family)